MSEDVKMSWDQFESNVDKLKEKIQNYLNKNNLKLSAIAPILREGGFTGLILAYKLNTWKVIPIQFKYMLIGEGEMPPLKQISEIPEIHYDIPKNPVILLIDNMPYEGESARLAAKKFKEKFPGSKIIYASVFQDVAFKDSDLFETTLFEIKTDFCDSLSPKKQKEEGVDTTPWVLPWQNPEEEHAAVHNKKYEYSN